MRELPRGIFDIYALTLPRGHGFGRRPPVGAWESDDGVTFGVLTRDEDTTEHGILVMRKRSDGVWAEVIRESNIGAKDTCLAKLEGFLASDQQPLPLPPNTAARPPLHDVGNRKPSALFDILRKPTHKIAAWTLNQLYLAMPNPDKNWVSDCQTATLLHGSTGCGNFATLPLAIPFRLMRRPQPNLLIKGAASVRIRINSNYLNSILRAVQR